MNVETISAQPNTPEWLKHRASCYNASELAAAMGLSKYQSRDDLIKRLATGITPEVDAMTQARFDKGHANEAKTLPVAEEIIGESLYATVLAAQVPELSRKLSASFDGLKLLQDVSWENKSPNVALVESLKAGAIPPEYHPQMEQGLMLSGAEKCLFTAGDGETVVHLWYHSNPELRAKIIPTWKQLEADVAAYVPAEVLDRVAPVGHSPDQLPALRAQASGSLVLESNIKEWEEAALAYIKSVRDHELKTDDDFANADAAAKWCDTSKATLLGIRSNLMGATGDVNTAVATLDRIADELDKTRIAFTNAIKARKDARKLEIVQGGGTALKAHIDGLNTRLGKAYMPAIPADFAGVVRGLKSLDSMQGKVSDELARAKIAANEIADKIDANLKYLRDNAGDHKGLFADAATIVLKAPEDLQSLVVARISEHKAEIERQAEQAREKIRAEEQAKAEKAAREKLEQEQAAQKAAAEAARNTLPQEQGMQQVLKAEVATPEATARIAPATASPSVGSMGAGQPADAGPAGNVVPLSTQVHIAGNGVRFIRPSAPPADTGARIKLGDINAAISPLAITADGLAALGFPVVATDKTSKLYRLADMPAMLAAMVAHIQAIQAKQAA